MISPAKQLGRYTILGDLGGGGMGSVSLGRAEHGQLVVLKRALHKEHDLDLRLIDEARVGFRLMHPNIVETLDLFYDDGRPVLVIAYVSGGSLFELRRRQKLPIVALARIGRQVADALHSIHTATDENHRALSIVHRDVTPANIMVGHDGDARLIDLGIARSAESNASRTASGFLRGTLRYLAPELFADSVHSPATDLWSLGLCILEAALGRVAVPGGDAEAVGKIIAWKGIKLLPDERLDPRLHDILHVLLQRDPRKRVSDARLASQMFRRLEEQFANTKEAAANLVETIMGPPRSLPTPDADSTELFVREAASTFCGRANLSNNLAETEGFENVYVDEGMGGASLGDLYGSQDAVKDASARHRLFSTVRAPANDDRDVGKRSGFGRDVATVALSTIILDDEDLNLGDVELERALQQFGLPGDDDTSAPAAAASGLLAHWPDANRPIAGGNPFFEPPADADGILYAENVDGFDLDDFDLPPDRTAPAVTKEEGLRTFDAMPAPQVSSSTAAVGQLTIRDCSDEEDVVVEGQRLTPSRPIDVAALGEELPVAAQSARARMAKACGFPDPPPTPADALRDYVDALRGLEAIDVGKSRQN